ncbi:MAG: acyl-CoA thioesterase II [Rhodospirillaceae bacterium]|nr:acyl-CoA thioesterase II [Rhodospirillaceae bacterium]|tara:strand:+ start:10331 stop:11197 length:867 start_codon:yes stop_codon:yes gene_type:complete
MKDILADLLRLLELERLEDNFFRGESRDVGSSRVFGGQVLGQALMAANYTVKECEVHSLHAYFLRPGDVKAPILYEVDRARDGKSFTNRRVVAIQHGRPIFNMAASFQIPEEGFEHQANKPDVPGPDDLSDISSVTEKTLKTLPLEIRRFLTRKRPMEMRPVDPIDFTSREPRDPVRHVWIRTVDKLPDDPDLHRSVLAYLSDYYFVGTATQPHGIRWEQRNVQMASLDHAMWFHRPFRADEWLLYAIESPNASGARGLATGRFFTPGGTLVASTAQEGLIRVWPETN